MQRVAGRRCCEWVSVQLWHLKWQGMRTKLSIRSINSQSPSLCYTYSRHVHSSPQPHGIRKPHAAQPDLHLHQLTDLRQYSMVLCCSCSHTFNRRTDSTCCEQQQQFCTVSVVVAAAVKKVKVAYIRLPSIGFWSWSRFMAVNLQVTWVINPAVGWHYFSARPAVTPTTLKRAATSFAAWWTEAQWVWTVCLRLLPDSIVAAIWTRALPRLSPAC